jgi:preprotein translocase subunit SecG
MLWTVITDILLVIFVLDCAFMGLVIMMQRSKQEGLGAAFGGGFTDSIWGAQTSQVLVKATVYAAAIFFVLSLCLARLYSHASTPVNQGSSIQQQLLAPVPVPATNATLAPETPASPAPAPTTPTTTPVSTWTTPPPVTTAPVKVTTPAAPAKPGGK